MQGQLISLGTAIFWTFSSLFFEYAGRRIGSLALNFIRLLYALILLGIVLLFTQGNFFASTSLEGWSLMVFSGLFGFIIGDFFLFQAFIDIGGRLSLLIFSATPIFGAIIDYFIFGETLHALSMLGILITLLGIALAVFARGQSPTKNVHLTRGILFALIGAFGQAGGLVFSKLGLTQGLNSFEVTQMRILVGLIGFALIIVFSRKTGQVIQSYRNLKASLAVFLGSIAGPVLGVWSSIYAMEFAPIGITSTISQLNTIFIIPFSVLVFKDKINKVEIIAAFVAFIGVSFLFLF